METTERIVEAYVRYVKGWATIPNIKCKGQFEIDLLAVDPVTGRKYHIESGVHTSSGFSKLTCNPFSEEALKVRVEQPKQRRTLGFFLERKFGAPEITEKLKEYGFEDGRYGKIIVSWGWTDEAAEQARAAGIDLWDFRGLLSQIGEAFIGRSTYFTDDTLRTLQLFARAFIEGGFHRAAGRVTEDA